MDIKHRYKVYCAFILPALSTLASEQPTAAQCATIAKVTSQLLHKLSQIKPNVFNTSTIGNRSVITLKTDYLNKKRVPTKSDRYTTTLHLIRMGTLNLIITKHSSTTQKNKPGDRHKIITNPSLLASAQQLLTYCALCPEHIEIPIQSKQGISKEYDTIHFIKLVQHRVELKYEKDALRITITKTR